MSAVFDEDTVVTTNTTFRKSPYLAGRTLTTRVTLADLPINAKPKVVARTAEISNRDQWTALTARIGNFLTASLKSDDRVRTATLTNAVRDFTIFITQLSGEVPAPSIYVAEDGELSIEWVRSNNRRAIVSFPGDGSLGYALLQEGGFVPGTDLQLDEHRPDISQILSYLR